MGDIYIERLAGQQLDSYRAQPIDLISHYNHESNISEAYRGRQLLELIQNADDAGEGYEGERRLLVRLTPDALIIANTGVPFSEAGIQSLIVSDVSPKKLSRSKYIGNKGLGFRSVLTWSRSPAVLSGRFSVAFSQEWAVERTLELADEIPALAESVNEWKAERQIVPAPIMRFPFVPSSEWTGLNDGEEIRRDGYDTVVVLPLTQGSRHESILADIQRQLEALSPEALLFCNNLETVHLETPERSNVWRVLREKTTGGQTIVLQGDGPDRLWSVNQLSGLLPPDLLPEELHETPGYEIAVAIPERVEDSKATNRLCVYFPTSSHLPMAVMAHATVATDPSRKHLIDHDANRFVLKELAKLVVTTAATDGLASTNATRALELLDGVQQCDGELRDLGFIEAVIEACEEAPILPLVTGLHGTIGQGRRPGNKAWYRLAAAPSFGAMLDPAAEDAAAGLLSTLRVIWFTKEHLSAALRDDLTALDPTDVGRLIGHLISERALNKDMLLPALRTASGRIADVSERVFLPSSGQQPELPEWVSEVTFLDASFAEGLRESLDAATVRDVRGRLASAGYIVDEYRLEAIARILTAAADAAAPLNGAINVWRDVLRTLFKLGGEGDSSELVRVPIKIITTGGDIRRADKSYLGPAYPRAKMVHALYKGLGVDEFVAAPQELGIEHTAENVETFLLRLGVAAKPRQVRVEQPGTNLAGYVEWILSGVRYPTTFFSSEPLSDAEVHQQFSVSFDGLMMPERFSEIVETADPPALIAYLLTDGSNHLVGGRVEGAVLEATRGAQRSPRGYPAVPVRDPVHFLLRSRPWVPCDDGQRRTPDRIILTRTGRRALGESFFRHTIDSRDDMLTALGISDPVERVLNQVGAVHSLDALPPDDLYSLLFDLPQRDAGGIDAPRIYRSLVERQPSDIDTPLREKFQQQGLMWGSKDGVGAYYPVPTLRYAHRFSVPRQVRERVPLVAIDPRRGAVEIERIFGVHTLSESDFVLQLDEEGTQYQPWSNEASTRVKNSLVHLYAFRLSRTADETSRERSALSRLDFRICSRIGVRVSVLDEPPTEVILDEDLDGLLVREGGLALLVSQEQRLPYSQVFWRSVGDLLADAIGVTGAAPEFAQLLSCQTADERRKLLDLMTDKQGEELLARARERLDLEDEEHIVTELSIPHPEEPGTPMIPATETSPNPEGHGPTNGKQITGTFESVAGPVRGSTHRHRLVVTRESKLGGGGPGQRCPESVSLNLVEAFERDEGRFPIRVEHVHGTDSFGCDIISVASLDTQEKARRERIVNSDDIVRFIEVKGRSDRTGAVGLTENQRAAAEVLGGQYYLYRVYRNVEGEQYELAILKSPHGSQAETIRLSFEYNLGEGSGADWYRLRIDHEPPDTGASDTPAVVPDKPPTAE